MPAFVGTAVETNLLGVLQGTLNGNTSILTPSGQTFYDPTTSVPNNFVYDGFVVKRGTLSEASGVCVAALPAPQNITQTLTLSSSHEVAQFRAGDPCFLVGNAYAGALGAVADTADGPLTVIGTSPVNQTVTVIGRNNAGGPPATSSFAAGSSLVMVSASAPGAVVNSASAGAPLDNQVAASLLTSFQNHCSSTIVEDSSGSTTTNFVCLNPGGFTELPSLVGATVTILTDPGTPANVGCSATVTGATIGPPVVLALDNFLDANGDSIAAWPGVPTNADTASLTLDLSNGKLAELGEAGGDYTRLVAAALTMHRKLDMLVAPTPPEIPLVNEWNMMGQATGTMLRTALPYVNAGPDLSITVVWDGAAGDIPFPLSGTLRVIDADDGVDSAAWATQASTSPYVAYTRQKRSNVLTFPAGVGALGANFDTGCIAMLNPAINGFAKTSGFSPEIPGKYLSGILWQLAEEIRLYAILGT